MPGLPCAELACRVSLCKPMRPQGLAAIREGEVSAERRVPRNDFAAAAQPEVPAPESRGSVRNHGILLRGRLPT